jgi:two-component system, OmpR family, sensor histidine kinase KdpD
MKRWRHWAGYAWALAATCAATVAGLAMTRHFDLVNIAMVYLLAVVIIALRFSYGPAILASLTSIATLDYLFVPPVGYFTVNDAQYLLTFVIVLGVALLIARLADNIRRQASLQSALQVEAETERVRSTLLASISHDLRTPLAILVGASSTLAESGERLNAEDRHALASSLFAQSRELSEHVAKVLQMTRLEMGTIELQREWTSIGEVAGAVLRRLEERLATHRLIVELPEDLPLVRVDAGLIEQALGNLLENAATHTPAGTAIKFYAQPDAGKLVVSVVDYGDGLPEGDIDQVFAKFHHRSAAGTGNGMGLGLAICRAIARLHGGDVRAERVSGGGAAFRLVLPLEAAPAVPDERSVA